MNDIKELKVNLEQKILSSGNIILVPHNDVDFDAIGSAIGLSQVVKKLKKASFILVNDPVYNMDYGVKLILDEAKKHHQILTKEKYMQIATPDDLYILTDVNKNNLVSIGDKLINKDNVVIIDHHKTDKNTVESNCIYIDENISSASEIIVNLLKLYSIKITEDVANYLLAGIYLDTNRLTKNITSDTMIAVAYLLDYGAKMNTVLDLFSEDFDSDRKVQELVSKVKISTYSIATVLAEEDLEVTKEELAKVVDYLLKYKVCIIFNRKDW